MGLNFGMWTLVFLSMGSPAPVAKAADVVAPPAITEKVTEHKRVKAVYWDGGYILLRADEKTFLDLGEKKKKAEKKPATKPIAKK